MPFLRYARDKRGYEHVYLVQPVGKRGKVRPRILYWYRTPPGVKVGRDPFDEEVRRTIEAQYPDVEFDWPKLLATPKPPPQTDVERWRERRRQAKAERAFMASADAEEPPTAEEMLEPEPEIGDDGLTAEAVAMAVEADADADAGDAAPVPIDVLTTIDADGTVAGAAAPPDVAPPSGERKRRRRRRRRRKPGTPDMPAMPAEVATGAAESGVDSGDEESEDAPESAVPDAVAHEDSVRGPAAEHESTEPGADPQPAQPISRSDG